MRSAELRDRFLSFFKARGHLVVPSDSLIPSGDPTVLFTSAGMSQFKDCFLGKRTDLRRAASCQKCLRTGDLEHVGKTPSHHSFFEMLGNFSFGDYFKAEAIGWAWEFLTGTKEFAGKTRSETPDKCLSLKGANLWVSVYEKDEEAVRLWRALGVPAERIKRFGQADNFWPANAPKEGPNGPCGPCSEIYFDPEGTVQGPKSVEVWNLVFTQYDRQPDGTLKPLPKPNIDTGMGLERLTRVVQGVETDYDTDLFRSIVEHVKMLAGEQQDLRRPATPTEAAVADHIRAVVFLLADGLVPSNESRGYVLRMLIRRMHRLVRVGLRMGPHMGELALTGLIVPVLETMRGSPYEAELQRKHDSIRRALTLELSGFDATLQSATVRLEEVIRTVSGKTIPGAEAFKLYDTYGLPLELTLDIAQEHGFTVDRKGFEAAMQVQQERSRAGSQFSGGVFVTDALRIRETLKSLPPREAQFIGYDSADGEARIQGLWDGAMWVDGTSAGQEVGIVLDRSPFYGESGGQVGDTGRLEGPKGHAQVRQTAWVDDVLVHHATVQQGTLSVQEPVRALVDADRRLQIARSHTATHLLHWALRKVLGPETGQAGSLVDADRLRFDFSSLQGLHEEQRHEVEALVNQRVRLSDEVQTDQMSLEEAKRGGALAFFGDKYGGRVRVVRIGDYSKELCGGTHLKHTGFVGSFSIVAESSIAAGTRRIEALVGDSAAQRQQGESQVLHEAARRLGRPARELLTGLEELLEQLKCSERERKALRQELATVDAKRLVAQGKDIDGVTYIGATLKDTDRETLAVMADAVKAALGRDGLVVLASADHGQVAVVMAATPPVAKRVHVGQLLKAVAPLIDGSGGGRPEFAQGGGKNPAGLPAALKRAEELLREALRGHKIGETRGTT